MVKDKQKFKNRIFTVLRIAISAGILFYLFKTQFKNFVDVVSAFRESGVNYWFIALSLAMYWAGTYLIVLRWKILLYTQKILASQPFLLGSYLVGCFFNNFLPTSIGGDIYRIYDSSKLKNSSAMKAGSIILVDRFIGVMSMVIYLVFALALGFVRTSHMELMIGKWKVSNQFLSILIVVLFALVIFIIFMMLFPDFFRLNRLFRKTRFLHMWEDKLRQIYDTLKEFRKFKVILFVSIVLSLILQLAFTLNCYYVGRAFGITQLSLIGFIFVVQISGILSMIPISVGGIGVREGAFIILLSALGAPKNIATIVSLVLLVIILIPGIAGGIIYTIRPVIDKKRALKFVDKLSHEPTSSTKS
ncbi:MAG: flippase-like domain-containing protein [Actinobacteria bacterium]|nr:flippase-like domain-containing protein [Chloroflexota bacterium]MBE3128735.1 flippase-like domain-containing protein [Actinomycetota bacterium]